MALLLSMLILAGCKDRGVCLSSHTVMTQVPNYIYVPGPKGTLIPTVIGFTSVPFFVCDRWESQGDTPAQGKESAP